MTIQTLVDRLNVIKKYADEINNISVDENIKSLAVRIVDEATKIKVELGG